MLILLIKRLCIFLFLKVKRRILFWSTHSLIITDNPTIAIYIEQFVQSAVKMTISFPGIELLGEGPRSSQHLVVVEILLMQIHDLIYIFSQFFINFITIFIILIFFDQFIGQIIDQINSLSFFHFCRILNFGFVCWIFAKDFGPSFDCTLFIL